MYTLVNQAGLYLMQVDGNTRDYTFTAELRLAMQFKTKQAAREQKYRLPIYIRTKVNIK